MRQFLFKAIKLIVVWGLILFALLLLLEIGFRLFRHDVNPLAQIIQKRSDVLFPPSASWHSVSSIPGEFSYDVHINRYGYRGKDFAMPKPADGTRVIAIGDSFTFGVGSPDDQTIPALLERDMKAQGLSIEVVNAGIGSASPVSHFVNLRDIHLTYQPDMVILFFDLTDLWDDWHAEREAVLGKNGEIVRFDQAFVNGRRDWWRTAVQHSAFCRYFNNKVVRTIGKMKALGFASYLKSARDGQRAKALIANASEGKAKSVAIEYDGVLFMRGEARKDLINEHWPRTQKYILKMRDLLASRGIPMMIVMYPHGIYVGGDQWKDGRKMWGFEEGKMYTDYLPFEMMANFCRREKIPFVNTLEAFLQAPKRKYFFDWDGHMMAEGNRIVVDAVSGSGVIKELLERSQKN